jgi:hypothetical protein
VVAVVDVHDASTGVVLSSREIRRKEFRAPFAYQRFAVNFDLVGRSGHAMETRVYWRDLSYVKVDKVVVSMGDGTYF